MIYLILGTNAYVAEQEIARIVMAQPEVSPERIDTSTLTENSLADIVRGGTLFSSKRLVVLRGLSGNKQLLDKLAEWAGEVSKDTTLVLVEAKLDKRTKAYKTLTKQASVIAVEPITERDQSRAVAWLRDEAKTHKVTISQSQAANMIARVLVPGEKPSVRVIDQMQLVRALEALAGTNDITEAMIATVLPPAASDTVFSLLELAAERKTARVDSLMAELRLSDDGHQTFALVASQWAQLVSVALADTPPATIAVELGMHPFVAKKFADLSRQFTKPQLKSITQLAADLDAGMKLSQFSPWDGVHRLIYAILHR